MQYNEMITQIIKNLGGASNIKNVIPCTARLRFKLILSTVVLSSITSTAYAGSCVENPIGTGIFSCSGAESGATDQTQNLTGDTLNVTTSPGFGIETKLNTAFYMYSTNGLTFTDNNGSIITGEEAGIVADNDGSGDLSITTTGKVTGKGREGIYAYNNGTDFTINAAEVEGGQIGIFAYNDGSGALLITTTGKVTGKDREGIRATNNGTSLTINAVEVEGGQSGIYAENNGSGALLITTDGKVTGKEGYGIEASNEGTDLTINAKGDVTGEYGGIEAYNYGTGTLLITTTGKVTSKYGYAINAYNDGSSLTINAAEVYGVGNGINAVNDGTGALLITTTGTVTSKLENGIYAENNGSGALSITTTGTVTGWEGISAYNDGTSLTINAAEVEGGHAGIYAENYGSGALSITTTGTVAGGENGYGIYAENYGTDLTINAEGDVTGSGENGYGIYAENNGSGALSITTTGTVTGGENGYGIYAENSGTGTDLTINAADVEGAEYGIYALNNGTGALLINTTGKVIGEIFHGIYADNYGTDLTINAADVEGAEYGINALNNGTGALLINTTSKVTSIGGDGIYADNYGTNLTINAADVEGAQTGIYAYNDGTGELLITTTGTVTGESEYGIYADNDGTNLTINAAEVYGVGNGINAVNNGAGALSITTTGAVTSKGDVGIYAHNDGTSLTINAKGDVTGGYLGIDAFNYGSGELSITTTGNVTSGENGYGIYAESDGTDLTINAADVEAEQTGIYAYNKGTGALLITTTGAVTSKGDVGIYAHNDGTNLTINAAEVEGGETGIYASNYGSGALSITTAGTVTGESEYGIYAHNQLASTTLITVETSSKVQGATAGIYVGSDATATIDNAGIIRNLSEISSALAIDISGSSDITINNKESGQIIGTVKLSNMGNNTVNNYGTWHTAGGTNDFGTNSTANSVNNYGSIMAASNGVDNPQETIFNNVGTFNNHGILSMDNNHAGDTLVINGDYDGKDGHLILNAVLGGDSSATDKLVINGDSTGTTFVTVKKINGVEARTGAQTINGIEIIEVSGLSDGEFIKYGRIVAGAYDYSIVRGADANNSNWYLSSGLSPIYPIDPIDPPIDTGNPTGPQVQRPEGGAYTANLATANNMFVTEMHDRLGETKYIDALTGEQKVTSMWLRSEGGHNRSRDASDQLGTQENRYVMQLGGDIARWSHNGTDSFNVGLMAGYGNSKGTTSSKVSGYSAKGTTDGYSAGIYGTWQANEANKSGLYVDSWAQYSWFNHSVNGQDLAREEYKSKGFTASIETGYTFNLGANSTKNISYFIQPKAQVIWMGVKADDHKEYNGTQVSGEGNNNIQAKLGLRAFMNGYSDDNKAENRAFETFVEANWIHNTNSFSTKMDNVSVKQDGAANIVELKLGVEGQLSKQVNVWGNIAQQVAKKGYSDTSVMFGIKYNF